MWGCEPVVWEVRVQILWRCAELCRGSRAVWEGWQKRTVHSQSAPHYSSYTQSNTMFPSLFNWLPLPTSWQWKHWLSATINHPLFVLHIHTNRENQHKLDFSKNSMKIQPQWSNGRSLLENVRVKITESCININWFQNYTLRNSCLFVFTVHSSH